MAALYQTCSITSGERERRLPPLEAILDVTLLAWEAAHRKRHGMVAVAPPNCFKVELRRVAMTQPSTTKIDASLEFAQALSDLKAGRVPCANEQELVDLDISDDREELTVQLVVKKTAKKTATTTTINETARPIRTPHRRLRGVPCGL